MDRKSRTLQTDLSCKPRRFARTTRHTCKTQQCVSQLLEDESPSKIRYRLTHWVSTPAQAEIWLGHSVVSGIFMILRGAPHCESSLGSQKASLASGGGILQTFDKSVKVKISIAEMRFFYSWPTQLFKKTHRVIAQHDRLRYFFH
jgi:hypothetical protein